LGADPEHSAIVGDQIQADVHAGVAAGIATILVTPNPSLEPSDPTPDLQVRDVADLLERLRVARG
jgi:predicted HAD superfamily phosphohydrolase YqeG